MILKHTSIVGQASALVLGAALTISGAASAEGASRSFNIPAGSMATALNRLAEAGGLQLVYDASIAEGLHSKGLSGTYAPEAALQQLLRNSGLSYRIAENGNVLIERQQLNYKQDLTALPAVQVIGKSNLSFEGEDPRNSDYARTDATTATKTDTPIMQTPMSVKVIPQQVLKDQQVVTLDQALRNVSGVVAGSGTDRQFFIRGFDVYNYYRDGFPMRYDWYNTQDLANVERVEVLKGPGSILYGRAEPGGIINFVTKQPQDSPYYSVRQQFGSYSHYRTDIDATGPLTANKDLAYRVNFAYQANDSITEFSGGERIFAAPTLRWNISDKTVSTLRVEYSDITRRGDNQLLLDANGHQLGQHTRRKSLSDPWDFTQDKYTLVSLNTEHRFNDNWSLKHRFNATFGSETSRNISPFALLDNGDALRGFWTQNTDGSDYYRNYFNALELTGKFDTGFMKHTLLTGWDYMHTDVRSKMYGNWGDPAYTINIHNPVHAAQPYDIPADQVFTYAPTQPWYGLYAQDQIELPYHVHVMAGLRYDSAETAGYTQTGFGPKIPNTVYSDDRVSPRGGVLWQPLPELSVYGSYTENFGASNGITATGQVLPAQTAQQWEAGVKTELWDGRFTGSLTYFDLKKQNLKMQDNRLFQRAIGEAESRGLELDLSGEVWPGLKLIGSYAYTPFAKTLKDTETSGTINKRLHNAPENSGNLWVTYDFQDEYLHGLKFGAGVQAVGRRYIGYTESMKTAGYATLNLMASQMWKIAGTQVTAQLNADNLLDKTYLGSVYSYSTGLYGAPRTFIGSIKVEY
ncbi:MAG: TonB-dependent receptor [Methylococcaceae bacterium]|nr:TonB-dependent receptor [Methylococcaceae bacterium]